MYKVDTTCTGVRCVCLLASFCVFGKFGLQGAFVPVTYVLACHRECVLCAAVRVCVCVCLMYLRGIWQMCMGWA